MQEKEVVLEESGSEKDNIFSDVRYICHSTSLILDALKRGLDVAQLSSGDIIITEVKVVNTQYSWNSEKRKMIKTNQL